MKTYQLPGTDLRVSCLGYGCMNLGGAWDGTPPWAEVRSRAARLVLNAVEYGIVFFDHADIYTLGKSETVFGEVLSQSPGLREKVLIQSKCGIRLADDPRVGDPWRYDFSYDHIVRSVEGSLRRLQTDRLDVLLLHQPDPLVEPDEVARAFDELQRDGKVRYFGVSNHTASQIELLKKSLSQLLVVNQLELSLLHAGLIEDGILANQADNHYSGAAGTLDYCRLHGILIQAWAPVARGKVLDPSGGGDEQARRVSELVAQLANEKGTTREAVALAWLLRHPAPIQPILGTTNVARLAASCQAEGTTLSREEWYCLLAACRGAPVP